MVYEKIAPYTASVAVLTVVLAGCQAGSPDPGGSGGAGTPPADASAGWVSERVDVGGHKLNLRCRGTGSPAIVFENGLGGNLGTWLPFVANAFPSLSFHFVPERDRAATAAEQENNPENLAFADTLEQAKALVPAIPNIPMLVRAATMGMGDLPPTWPAKEMLAARKKQLGDLTAAVPCGELRYVDTGHFIQQLQPQLVIDEIQRMSGLPRRTVPS